MQKIFFCKYKKYFFVLEEKVKPVYFVELIEFIACAETIGPVALLH
jgi:hypothetical protein